MVRRIKNLLLQSFGFGLLITLAVACGNNSDKSQNRKEGFKSLDKLHVISSFTILSDIVRQIGGERVEVYNMVPTGTDPHDYVPFPKDVKATTDADLLVKNGLNLEGGDNGWFAKLVRTTNQNKDRVYQLTKGVEPMYLKSKDGRKEEINPHAFLNPVVGIQIAKNARDALIEVDTDHEEGYRQRATKYIDLLKDFDEEYQTKINEIPEEDRILVTSERAFQYLAAEYGLKEGYIWAIDTQDNGTPEQIKSLLSFLKEYKPPVLFVETNVDKRPMRTVSSESGIEIYGPIYSDEIGEPGEEVDTYEKYLRYNLRQIYNGLAQNE